MRELGAEPVEQLLKVEVVSEVFALRLADGREVVVKRRDEQAGRAESCVSVQRLLADSGFPCARPLTGATVYGGSAIHSEEWRPDGEILRGDTPELAERSAWLLADLMSRLDGIDAVPPLPNPEWVNWNHDGLDPFPANPRHDARVEHATVPRWIEDVARRTCTSLRSSELSCVIGHADSEAQNLRWRNAQPYTVHDWDSLAWLPEAAIAGAAAGAFASVEIPTLTSIDSSAVFLDGYQRERGRPFTRDELRVAWAASIWPALHNARVEVLYEQPPHSLRALEEQAEQRLALAGA